MPHIKLGKKEKGVSIRGRMVRQQLMLMFMSLLFCGIIFLIAMSIRLRQYIVNDIEYYLETANTELRAKIDILQNAVIALRNDEIVTSYLDSVRSTGGSQAGMDALLRDFSYDSGVYANTNMTNSTAPFVETVYLSDNEGHGLLVHYYPVRIELEAQLYAKFGALCESFAGSNSDYMCLTEGDYIYVYQTFYNKFFRSIGKLVFSVRKDALLGIVNRGKNYPGMIWYLSDKSGSELASLNYGSLSEHGADTSPAVFVSGTVNPALREQYMFSTQQMPFKIYSFMAMPKSLVDNLLFSSMWAYGAGVLTVLAVSAIVAVALARQMVKPLSDISKRVRQVSDGDFSVKLPDYDVTEFRNISRAFNAMTASIERLIKEGYEKQLLIRESELKLTLSQMNPHFMFNILTNIGLQARLNGDEDVSRKLSVFAKLIQATLYRKGKDKVTIREELEYVGYYMGLQRDRYADRLTYDLRVDDDTLLDLAIPKLCVQSLVENAVVHGCEPKTGESHLTVTVRSENETVLFEIEDDGAGFPGVDGEVVLPLPEKETRPQGGNLIGLNNVCKIIRLTYGEDYGVRVFSSKRGSKATISIPFDRP